MRKRILSMALLSAVNAIAAVSVLRLIQYLEDGFDHTNHGKIVDLSGTLSQTIFELPVGWMRRFVIELDGKKCIRSKAVRRLQVSAIGSITLTIE